MAGQPLDGSKHSYVLRFQKEDIPPVNGFWSLTTYSLPRLRLVANPIHRYSLGDRTAGVTYGADGSLTIYIQSQSPGADKEDNWLPAPNGPFDLVLRLYWPQQPVLDQQWSPPPVTPAT